LSNLSNAIRVDVNVLTEMGIQHSTLFTFMQSFEAGQN